MSIPVPVRDERGAAIVWTLALLTVLLMSGALASAVAVHAVARQRVATIAELAAIAAAQSSGDPCAAAMAEARANDAEVTGCGFEGSDVVVSVRRPTPEFVARVLATFGGRAPDLDATARAGPP